MSKEVIRPNQFAHADTALLQQDQTSISEAQKQELAQLYSGALEGLTPGKLINGTVVSTSDDGLTVDISYKSYGFIPRYEFAERELKKFAIGDTIEVMLDELENVDGNVVLSYEKAKATRAWDAIMKLFEEGKPVEGIVTHKVKGGLSVDVGIPAFLPGSQIDLQRVTDFDQYVNQTLTAHIIKINRKRGNIIISRRKYLSEIRDEARKKIIDTLDEGQVLTGIVKNITNYGAFIDVGGLDGLLHITDMTWGRIAHPSELLNIGDKVTVKILSFDRENLKISLGLKQLSENPWQGIEEAFKVGDRIKGKISSITDYGIFVEVKKGVEGLVHISEVSWVSRINNLAQMYNVGDPLDVVVVSLDPEKRRMSLSIKQLDKNPWEQVQEKFNVGDTIEGKISNITDFGIFVQLLPGIDGLVHVSDLSWTKHIEHPEQEFKKDDIVKAVILGIDVENKKVSLGIKQLAQDPWETVSNEYQEGSTITGTVSKIADFGAFVRLPVGVEGLIHSSELENAEKRGEQPAVGQEVTCKIISLNPQDRRIALSLDPNAPTASQRKSESATRQHRDRPSGGGRKSADRRPTVVESGSKGKSLLQLELEKLRAAQTEKANDKDNTESSN